MRRYTFIACLRLWIQPGCQGYVLLHSWRQLQVNLGGNKCFPESIKLPKESAQIFFSFHPTQDGWLGNSSWVRNLKYVRKLSCLSNWLRKTQENLWICSKWRGSYQSQVRFISVSAPSAIPHHVITWHCHVTMEDLSCSGRVRNDDDRYIHDSITRPQRKFGSASVWSITGEKNTCL